MASSSRSRASGSAAAAGGSLGSLSDPQLASLPAVELVVRLYNHRRASDFSDAALVLAARELRLADAEAQIRRADEKEARLVAEIRAWERRADEALLCAVRGDDDHTAAMVGEKEVVEAPEVEESPDDDRVSQMEELTPRDCTPSAVESAGGGGLAAVATLADEAGDDDDVDRLSTLSTVALLLAPTPTLQRESELGCNSGDEGSWKNNVHALASVSQGNVLPDTSSIARSEHELGQREPKNHRLSTLPEEMGTNQEPNQDVEITGDINTSAVNKGKGQAEEERCAYVLSVASSKATNHDAALAEHEQTYTESELREMLSTLEDHVSAWESEFDTADGGSMPEEATVHEGRIVDQSEDQGRSEATEVRNQDDTFLCEHRVVNANKPVITDASETEEHLRAEIKECKERAMETEVRLWAEIQARGSAVADVEAWKHCAEEAQRQIHAASMVEARLRDELATWKRRATEAEASHRAEIKASQEKAAEAMTHLQDEISQRDHKFMEYKARMEDKMCAVVGYYTAIQTGLRATNDGAECVIRYFQNEVQDLRAKISNMEQQRAEEEQRVSGHEEHVDLAPSSHGQTSGQ